MKPFPGLRAFDCTEADLFFGRDEQICELLARLGARPFLAVVGPSGSGKSSLVRAGLIPTVTRGYLGGVESVWRIAVMRPGFDPYGELARELANCFGLSSPDVVLPTLRGSSLGLTDFIREHLKPTERFFLFIDQFEELIRCHTQAGDHGREESWAFVKLLLAASNQDEIPLRDAAAHPAYIVVTMRSDCLGNCAQVPGLSEALNHSQYLVPRFSRDQQREAIEGPIGLAGAEITPLLVQRLLNDLRDSSDQLPVLQQTLSRIWEESQEARGHGVALDLPHYVAVGGLKEALNRDAEEAFRKLEDDPKREMIARRVFQCLVELEAEGEASRRPTRLSELAAITNSSPAKVQTVVDAFRERGFLLESNEEDPLIDISHESLIRLWSRLHQWIREEAESAAIYARLADSAIHNLAYRDPELSQAIHWKRTQSPNAAWAHRYTPENTFDFPQAIGFLLRKRLRRLTLRTAAGLAFITVCVALIVTAISYREARSARQQAEQLFEFMAFNLRDKLEPIGRLDLLDDVSQRVNAYYTSLGVGNNSDSLRHWAAAQDIYGAALEARGKLSQALRVYEADRAICQRLAEQDPGNIQRQRDLSISEDKVGGVLEVQGKLSEALRAYEVDRAICQRLAEQDPGNAQWQRDLSVSQNKVGSVLEAQGKLSEALRAYEASRKIRQHLAEQDPGNAQWQRDLSISQNKVGSVLEAQGKLNEALVAYEASRKIRQRLAVHDPSNDTWQRDLSVSQNKVGGVLEAQGKLSKALEAYEAGRAVATRLAQQDPGNAQWQRDLAISLDKVGGVLEAQVKLGEALQAYKADRAIRQRLAEQDPGNAQWQRELSISQNKVGSVLEAQGRLSEALQAYDASRTIRQHLLRQDPGNAQWQRDLSVSQEKVGGVLEAQGNLNEALEAYQASRTIVQRLTRQDPSNATWQTDLLWVKKRIMDARHRLGTN